MSDPPPPTQEMQTVQILTLAGYFLVIRSLWMTFGWHMMTWIRVNPGIRSTPITKDWWWRLRDANKKEDFYTLRQVRWGLRCNRLQLTLRKMSLGFCAFRFLDILRSLGDIFAVTNFMLFSDWPSDSANFKTLLRASESHLWLPKVLPKPTGKGWHMNKSGSVSSALGFWYH